MFVIKKSMVLYSTIIIYFLTLLFHLFISSLTDNRNFLGIVMLLPIIVVFIYQFGINKLKTIHTFGLTKPTISSILFAISVPMMFGCMFQMIFYFTKKEYFLFTNVKGFFLLLLISLTISSLSAFLEEVVWRGNYYYYLRKKYTLWKTSIITASIWSIWHLPIGLFYKNYKMVFFGTIMYMGTLFILSILLTYIRSWGKSVYPAAIFHGMFNSFYFTRGSTISWNLEYIEFTQFLFLLCVFVIFCSVYKLKIDCKK